ncbi:1-phosphatidylinositol 4,5-bisphosphate phosphodiesterase eta-2, partial [Characodon lateralis]|nr:1-phosphatidylinositol 4,5-bisphosphate phosphodiesterase eta-2 [Characodon lateralis]
MPKVTKDHCLEIINKFEPCSENQKQGALGIDGFTNYMRSPAGDIFNPEHYNVNQDMTQPLCNYFIASSHNTYLMGDQLMSQSRVDMYAWVLQAGCRCVEGALKRTLFRTKQPDRDPLFEVVSVRFQTDSGAVRLWSEYKPAPIRTNSKN